MKPSPSTTGGGRPCRRLAGLHSRRERQYAFSLEKTGSTWRRQTDICRRCQRRGLARIRCASARALTNRGRVTAVRIQARMNSTQRTGWWRAGLNDIIRLSMMLQGGTYTYRELNNSYVCDRYRIALIHRAPGRRGEDGGWCGVNEGGKGGRRVADGRSRGRQSASAPVSAGGLSQSLPLERRIGELLAVQELHRPGP